jgi:hypothetical protein
MQYHRTCVSEPASHHHHRFSTYIRSIIIENLVLLFLDSFYILSSLRVFCFFSTSVSPQVLFTTRVFSTYPDPYNVKLLLFNLPT